MFYFFLNFTFLKAVLEEDRDVNGLFWYRP